ncbi:MAG: hypothetical protein LH614_19760 [Pyrinomonadaceae bacterium]|nr:hypothetical protein [Pyrinomonadaceae bacterium]
MKTKNQTFIIALAMMLALAIVPTITFGQNKTDNQILNLSQDEQVNDLVGVWEAVGVPSENDCATGAPIGELINVTYTFNQGGTMNAEDTLSIDRYRTTGSGIWKRTSGRSYTYRFFHYAFNPDGTFFATVKGNSNLKLSRNGNSLTESGTFQLIAPDGTTVIYAGCFNGTSHRVTF